MRWFELSESIVAAGEVDGDGEGAAEGFDDALQRADLHVVLLFKLGDGGLFDAELAGEFDLRNAFELAEFGQEHLGLQFVSASLGFGNSLGAQFFTQFADVSVSGHFKLNPPSRVP